MTTTLFAAKRWRSSAFGKPRQSGLPVRNKTAMMQNNTLSAKFFK